MVSRNGEDAVVRHILRIPQITAPEINDATVKLDSIRSQLIAGDYGFGGAVAKYSDDDVAKSTAGQIMGRDGSTFLTIDQLDKDMVLLLKNSNLKPGEYSKPTPFTDERGKKAVRIVLMVSKPEPHRENLKHYHNPTSTRALPQHKSPPLAHSSRPT